MSKEETPITAEKFQAEHYKDASCCSLRLWTNEMVEQYAQAKVKELQKENERLKFNNNKLRDRCYQYTNQITQLQKERDELLEGISEIKDMCRLYSVYEKCIDLLTNKKEG